MVLCGKAYPDVLEKEKNLQDAMVRLKQKFGKNAVLKGTNFLEGATMRERNMQIGGHRAGEAPTAGSEHGDPVDK